MSKKLCLRKWILYLSSDDNQHRGVLCDFFNRRKYVFNLNVDVYLILLRLSEPIGSSCIDNNECISGALCRNGNCLCPNGFRNQDGRCLPIDGAGGNGREVDSDLLTIVRSLVPIGGRCALGSDCAGGAICSNLICTCPDGRTPSAGGVCVFRQKRQYSGA